MQTLTARALNRATLARQSLLTRSERRPADLIEHLVGLQAQAPLAPYVALWSRLIDFQPEQLSRLLTRRRVVRTSLMRATIHLVTATDAGRLRAVLQPMLAQRFAHSPFARDLVGMDLAEVRAAGVELLTDRALTRAELGASLARRWPDRDPSSLAYAVTFQVPLVHVPPRGVWGGTGPVRQQTAASWLQPTDAPPADTAETPARRRPGRHPPGHETPVDLTSTPGHRASPGPTGSPPTHSRPTSSAPPPQPESSTVDEDPVETLITRYLGGFGPASVRDMQAWSGLTRLREVVDRMRPGLATFRDEQGVELFDRPDAPRPDPDTPAPPRFLPEYDNLLLSHADRSRVIPDGRKVPLYPGNGAALGTVLLDGTYRANWKLDRTGPRDRLIITPFARLNRAERSSLQQEAQSLLSLLATGSRAGAHPGEAARAGLVEIGSECGT